MANVTDYSQLWKIHGALAQLLAETTLVVGAVDTLYSVADYFDVSGTAAGNSARSAIVESYAKKVDELHPDGRLGLQVRSGTLSPEKWAGIAQSVWDGCVQLQEDAGKSAFRFTDVWGEVVVPTAITVKEEVAGTAEAVKSNAPAFFVLLVVGLVALVVLRLAP